MNTWITNQNKILREPYPDDAYFQNAYNFAIRWLDGMQEIVLSTSGSTGEPKPISLLRRQMKASAKMTALALNIPEHSRALICLNVQYIAGIMMIVRSLDMNWEMTFVKPTANPLEIFDKETSFDFVALVPFQLSNILENNLSKVILENCGKILVGGAQVSTALLEEIQKLSIPIYQSYGMTETVSHIALRRLNGPSPQLDYNVLDGIEIGKDERGCLFISGEVTDYQTIQTNDIVTITSDRTFQWVGRADSVINSGGVKIQLQEVEAQVEKLITEIFGPKNFFAWFEADEKLGQKLVLFIEGFVKGFDQNSMMAKLKAEMHPYLIPKAVYFVPTFYRTPTEKLDKIATSNTYFKDLT